MHEVLLSLPLGGGGGDSHSVMTWGVWGCLVLSYDVIREDTGDWSTKHGSFTGRSMKHIRLAGTFVWLLQGLKHGARLPSVTSSSMVAP
jgi:hypothetical protein